MARWQSELHPSALARRVTFALYIALIAGLLLLPWPPPLIPAIGGLLLLLLIELRYRLRLQRSLHGQLTADESRYWHWRQQKARVTRPPFVLPFGILLSLRTQQGKRLSLWLMRDSMNEASWRALRRLLKGQR
ncbi:protein YgfX [Erwinia sp. PK3-005]|uniref:Protein YgfX n=1 Tax=Mixta hanseatica TaxID=2872648 RepID=A0ABY4R963_9GAMM|nr:protein YgfX [Mixta hanseatica]UQY43507.1 protein YgfX [Mixta hanseatica]